MSKVQGKLVINRFGQIPCGDIFVKDFTVLMGGQATGKSMIAKSIYFFRTIKDEIFKMIIKYGECTDSVVTLKLLTFMPRLEVALTSKVTQIFGQIINVSGSISLRYYYADETWALLSCESQDEIKIGFSENINLYLAGILGKPIYLVDLYNQLNDLFHDNFKTVFIPAGRNLTSTLLTLNNKQRKMLDYCTLEYVDYIKRIRPSFTNSIDSLTAEEAQKGKLKFAQMYTEQILRGEYIFTDDMDYLCFVTKQGRELTYSEIGCMWGKLLSHMWW